MPRVSYTPSFDHAFINIVGTTRIAPQSDEDDYRYDHRYQLSEMNIKANVAHDTAKKKQKTNKQTNKLRIL
jgi:hypothetical protein